MSLIGNNHRHQTEDGKAPKLYLGKNESNSTGEGLNQYGPTFLGLAPEST